MQKSDQNHDSQMSLSRFLYVMTIHRRLRREIQEDILGGNLNRLPQKVVLFLQLLRANWQLKRAIRGLSDYLYDQEFGDFPSFERRLYACVNAISEDIEWMNQQEDLGLEWENLSF